MEKKEKDKQEVVEENCESPNVKEENKEKPLAQKEQPALGAEESPNQLQLLTEIKTLIDERLSYDAVKEKAIDSLNDEMKFYRDNFVFQSQKPIFIELIMLYDNLAIILNSLNVKQDLTKEEIVTAKNNLDNLKEELLEILCRRDITPFDEHPELLDYKKHKTVKTIPTSEESENNKVDKIMKIGFHWNDKIFRPEEVIIKKFVKP